MFSGKSQLKKTLPQFQPLFGFETAHSQTCLGHLLPSPLLHLDTQTHILTLVDGDQLHLEYAHRNSQTTALLMHGLGSDYRADYIQRTALLCSQQGWNIVLVNHRGASPKASAQKTYHSGRAGDIEAILFWCKEKFKQSKMVCVGFSMSGSMTLNLVSEPKKYLQPDFAIAINAPLKLREAALSLTQSFNKVYDLRFYLKLKKLLKSRGALVDHWPPLASTYFIDEHYTSRTNGYINAFDYYNQCSSFPKLSTIETPTYVLSSLDDPFIAGSTYLEALWSPATVVTLTKAGGHMGYIARNKMGTFGRRWLDVYLNCVFSEINSITNL